MIDINFVGEGLDLSATDTDVFKAQNILQVQLGSLEYEPEFGIDLEYFLDDNFRFQNESFQAYLIQVLTSNGINVTSLVEQKNTLFRDFIFNIAAPESGDGLIAR